MELSPGTVIGNAWRADKRVGSGGMGQVWAGVRLSDRAPIALKMLLPAAAARADVSARFRREAQVLERVRSDHVARVFEFVEDPEFGLLLVLEYIPGESLSELLSRERRLPLERALSIGLDICRGLRDLHEARIVHRDLKPANVVLKPVGRGRVHAVLIDFGISRILADSSEDDVTAITRAGTVLGTMAYTAPEQITGSRSVTGTADLYALGALLYRAMAGRHAFVADSDAEVVVLKMSEEAPPLPLRDDTAVSIRTQALVGQLLAREPSRRCADASEVIRELESILAEADAASEDPTLHMNARDALALIAVPDEPTAETTDMSPPGALLREQTDASQADTLWRPSLRAKILQAVSQREADVSGGNVAETSSHSAITDPGKNASEERVSVQRRRTMLIALVVTALVGLALFGPVVWRLLRTAH